MDYWSPAYSKWLISRTFLMGFEYNSLHQTSFNRLSFFNAQLTASPTRISSAVHSLAILPSLSLEAKAKYTQADAESGTPTVSHRVVAQIACELLGAMMAVNARVWKYLNCSQIRRLHGRDTCTAPWVGTPSISMSLGILFLSLEPLAKQN